MRILRALFLIFLFSVCADVSYALDWKSLNEEADRLPVRRAEELYAQAPGSVEKHYVLGLAYLRHYQYEEAQKIFEAILAADPEMFEARWGVADALCWQHEFKKSEAILKKILKEHPSFAPAYLTWGYIRYIRLDFKGSAEMTGKLINLDEKTVDITTLVRAHGLYAAAKGMLAEYGGPFSKSVNFFAVKKHLKIAESLQPDSFTVYFGWGNFYMSVPAILGRDLDKAQELFEKASQAEPLFPDTYVRLAQVAKAKGDEKEYERLLGKALKLDPKNELAADVKSGACKFICLD